MQIYVHDFYWDYIEIENSADENDFFYELNIYYNFSEEDPGDSLEDLEYFHILVGNPIGIAKYLSARLKEISKESNFFFGPLLIMKNDDKEEMKNKVKTALQSIRGGSEKELILKAMRSFDWEWASNPEVFNKLINS
ncbi:hypothetical protein [Chitinophaga sp. Cy-1792]|uniref:hypothetical protein n=1 Tax=Chitinophaga sp. Cy-1792 TaxID=2608339 RepID=UPI00141EE51C|nr:hypothetical protein [Chitinophaga sp. Cy-1792]NIG55827.1 hypothetical protein [Chitinophaga sp. Cy-1792]